jgi:hypothetical protein
LAPSIKSAILFEAGDMVSRLVVVCWSTFLARRQRAVHFSELYCQSPAGQSEQTER